MTERRSVFFGSDIFRASVYGDNHPLNIARVWPAIDICRHEGWLDDKSYHAIPPASPSCLKQFHDSDYIDALLKAQQTQSLPAAQKERFSIGCAGNPIFAEIYDRPATAANASLIGARWLAQGRADIVYNPAGGTHHGMRGKANGFCFVNDPAIALEELCRDPNVSVTYLDIDAHHCDGVQDWHYHTSQLQILSIHQSGLWPRTGLQSDKGGGNAHNFTLPAGAQDSDLLGLIEHKILPLIEQHRADYLVLQAGVDGHRDDPQSKLQYSLQGYWQTISYILALDVPSLVLGGGGYNPYITAKAWAGVWALITKRRPHELALSKASREVLTSLSWHHRLGRNPPHSWFSQLGDLPLS